MSTERPQRLRFVHKLQILVFGLVALATVGTVAIAVGRDGGARRAELVRSGTALAGIIAQAAEFSVYTEDTTSLEPFAQAVRELEGAAWLVVRAADGRPLLEVNLDPAVTVPPADLSGGAPVRELTPSGGEVPCFDLLVPITTVSAASLDAASMGAGAGGEDETIGYVQLGLSQASLMARQRELMRDAATFAALLMLLAALVTIGLTRRLLRPVDELVRVAARIAEGDLDGRVPVGARDEIGDLARAFNNMVDRLAVSRAEVEAHQGHLEEMVADRTQELEATVLEARRLAIEAQAASKAKSQFLANVSHEIRTPLNAVLGLTELLQQERLTTDQLRMVETVYEAGRGLLSVINQVLDLSKAEEGLLELDPRPFDLRDLVESVVVMFGERASAQRVDLTQIVDPTLPICLEGDPDRVRQILLNLVSNAVKFTQDGHVVLRVDRIAGEGGRSEICFRVEDTGMGISDEVLPRLFQPFVQADGSMTRRFGGTGLGLSISRGLAELMDGTLTATSALGQGSTFTFCAPLPEGDPASARDIPACGPGSALLFAHDRLLGEMLQNQVGRAGLDVQVRLAPGPDAAEAPLGGAAPRVVLVDLALPESAALECVQAARRAWPDAPPPLVLLQPIGVELSPALQAAATGAASVPWPVRTVDLARVVAEQIGVVGEPGGGDAAAEDARVISGRVLVVEDNPINRRVARGMLTSAGVEILLAGNGREGVEAWREHRPDLILMDCQMPEMDGFEATACIRTAETAEGLMRTPVIALTAHAMDGDADGCRAAGMDDYLSKPYSLDQLCGMLRRWLPRSPNAAGSPAQG